jgi:hypothetical protein
MTGLLAVAFQSGDISIRQSTSPIFSAETNLVTCAHTAEYLAGYKSADDLRPPLLLLLLLAQTARTSSKVHQPTTATTTSEMEGIKQKIKSCKCDKNQVGAEAARLSPSLPDTDELRPRLFAKLLDQRRWSEGARLHMVLLISLC